MRKYSFWIIPTNKIFYEVERIIKHYNLSKYKAPIFIPHTTIHGVVSSTDEEVVKAVERVARVTNTFKISVGPVEFSTTYFQCVYARLKPNTQLVNTHLALQHSLGIEKSDFFIPHCSLMYGDIDIEARAKIASEIKLAEKIFEASAITIVRADSSDPKEWEIVKQVQLARLKFA